MLKQAFPDANSLVLEKLLQQFNFDMNEVVQMMWAGANVLEQNPKTTYADALKWEVFWTDYAIPDWDWPKVVSQMQPALHKIAATRNKLPLTLLASEIIDWILDNTWIRTRGEAEELGQTMLADGWLETVEVKGKKMFRDSDELFFWFSNKPRTANT